MNVSAKTKTAFGAALLALSVLAVFAPLGQHDFIDFDDNVYVTDNRRVQSGLTVASVHWAFTTLDAGFWHPLAWLSLMLDYELYGLRAGGFHWTSILFHAFSAALLFLAMNRMTGALWKSLFVAALFAFHPLRVEPVAWIAERKDVIATFFWILTLFAYAAYAARPGKIRYGLVLLPFVLGLMAKPTLVTLPFVLLLMDWWPLRRVRPEPALVEVPAVHPPYAGASLPRLVAEKLPLLFLSVLAASIVYVAERNAGALSPLEAFPLAVRFENALVSYVAYLGKTVWPMDLAVYYPHPGAWPLGRVVASGALLTALTQLAVCLAKRRPYGIVGWLWYLGVLVPVIGMVQIGFIAMADRYAYVPQIGLFIIAAWGVPDLLDKMPGKKAVLAALGLCTIAAFIFVSQQQMKTWQNTLTVFQQALRVTVDNSKAHHGMGMAYFRQGRADLAHAHLAESLRIRKEDRVFNDLGTVLMGQRRFAEAERQFREADRLKPGTARYANNLGASLAAQGRLEEAVRHFREALRIDPDYATAKNNLTCAMGQAAGK
ncbi:MAG: tetratricopeptide repeat protein [Syntrophales bacterium]|jgi:tetratricopeptide (TPR) repeat protein|nr:tetratricopeptide repeat protein [Syntrophales bacterium]